MIMAIRAPLGICEEYDAFISAVNECIQHRRRKSLGFAKSIMWLYKILNAFYAPQARKFGETECVSCDFATYGMRLRPQ